MATSKRKARMFRQREQELLDAAAALYGEQDWRSVSVDRVAERAGIAKGTVYLHVRSKEEVAAKLALRYLKRVAGAWSRVPAEGSSRERALALLRAAQEVALSQPGQFPLVLAALLGQEGHDQPIRQELQTAWSALSATLCSALLARSVADSADQSGQTQSALAWAIFQAVSQPPPLSPAGSPPPDPLVLLQHLSNQ